MRKAIDSLLLAAVLSATLSLHLCEAFDRHGAHLRRKRNANAFQVPTERKGIHDSEFQLEPEEHLEDLWSRAMAVEEELKLDERFLQMSVSFSIPTRPPTTRGPAQAPTPQPTSGNDTTPSLNPTLSPSGGSPTDCLAGTTREAYLLTELSAITAPSLLQDPATPQGQAFAWIVNLDPLQFDPCTYPTIDQRYGLATFYFSTVGTAWIRSDGWIGEMVECGWFGVTCAAPTNTTVERLQLPLNNVGGLIPNEVSTLFDALRIDLFGNGIAGILPTGLGNLTKLELLDLEENDLVGNFFTPEVLSLTNLIGLRGSFNEFTGIIPGSIEKLTALEQLWFADNNIAGPIPAQITNLASLESLFGYTNLLNGSIPVGFGGLVNFTQIRLYNNKLTAVIPDDLFDATKLETIRLDSNQMTGTIPTTIGNLLALQDLRLFENTLFGDIPSEIGNLLMLQNLILNNNFFEGTLPPAAFNPEALIEFIDFSNNKFLVGALPSTMFDLPSVRNVYLANCTLTGTIPANYASPPDLRDLFLDGNAFQGTVPAIAAGQLTRLNEFLLQGNLLTGSMPESICALRVNTTGILEDLWSDCLGETPEIICDFPGCCNRCF